MKSIKVFVIALLLSACSINGNGNGNVIQQSRDVGHFDTVRIRNGIDAQIHVGQPVALNIEADSNLQPYISTSVFLEKLTIKTKNRSRFSFSSYFANITTPELTFLDVDGSSDIKLTGEINNTLTVDLSGSNRVYIDNINAEQLVLKVSGSGEVQVSGKVDYLKVDISGRSDIDLSLLDSKEADIDISGSAEVDLGRVDVLDVGISGSGKVTYLGTADLNVDLSGSGGVHARKP